jgi:hybrid cluster-associated redox disulfide protein
MLTPQEKYFRPDMPVAEAMSLHPRAAEVFAAFHLGGCSHCGISQWETIEQVCAAYGVEVETLLEVLESLMSEEPAAAAVKADEAAGSAAAVKAPMPDYSPAEEMDWDALRP